MGNLHFSFTLKVILYKNMENKLYKMVRSFIYSGSQNVSNNRFFWGGEGGFLINDHLSDLDQIEAYVVNILQKEGEEISIST